MADRPSSKWIDFVEIKPSASGKTRRFEVVDKAARKPGDEFEPPAVEPLGTVSWYGAWRRYAFWPGQATVYEATCLRDIAAFCDWLMREDRKSVV